MSSLKINETNLENVKYFYLQNLADSKLQASQQAPSSAKTSSRAGQRRLRTETQVQPKIASLNQELKAKGNAEEIAEILLRYGADHKKSVLERAIRRGDLTSVKKLIEYSGCSGGVLDWACEGRNIEMLKYLAVEKGLSGSRAFSLLIGQSGGPFFEGIDLLRSQGVDLSKCKNPFESLFNLT